MSCLEIVSHYNVVPLFGFEETCYTVDESPNATVALCVVLLDGVQSSGLPAPVTLIIAIKDITTIGEPASLFYLSHSFPLTM